MNLKKLALIILSGIILKASVLECIFIVLNQWNSFNYTVIGETVLSGIVIVILAFVWWESEQKNQASLL